MSTTPAQGIQTAVLNTTHVLASTTQQGLYILRVGLDKMQAGDTVIITRRTRIGTSGQVVETQTTLTGDQTSHAVNESPDVIGQNGLLEYTLRQTAGTARTYDWELIKA